MQGNNNIEKLTYTSSWGNSISGEGCGEGEGCWMGGGGRSSSCRKSNSRSALCSCKQQCDIATCRQRCKHSTNYTSTRRVRFCYMPATFLTTIAILCKTLGLASTISLLSWLKVQTVYFAVQFEIFAKIFMRNKLILISPINYKTIEEPYFESMLVLLIN